MTDLQTSLIGAGAIVVIGVVVFNVWQARKMARTAQPFSATMDQDMDSQTGELKEPVFIQEDTVTPTAIGEMTLAEPDSMIQVFSEDGINPLVDAITPVTLETERSGAQIEKAFDGFKKVGNKTVKLEGYNRSEHIWEAINPGVNYLQLRIGLQMACRRGPLSSLEYSEFASRLQRATEPFNAFVDVPDMSAIIMQAEKLDQLAANHDLKISLNLVSDGAPWAPATVRHIAQQDRWMPIAPARYAFVREDSLDEPIFFVNVPEWLMSLKSMSTGGTQQLSPAMEFDQPVQALTLLLDVPRAKQELKPFAAMRQYAETLSAKIGAQIVDDNGQPLPPAALDAIDQQLLGKYEEMQAYGIVAGSSLTRRLYAV
ncbi:cell division protein ZipA C-terminal FtsZ-binding domain-containing protein [Ampullimonas aquatilis]|uniref:cell division protein ZipA C-terminal FtsZ-binding domain-containing protein n=1 Tax=Ampullimonas aquatilis TaxID=1341549 RepID=UPI003C76B04C